MEASIEGVEASMEERTRTRHVGVVNAKSAHTPRRSRGLALPLPSNLPSNQRPVTLYNLLNGHLMDGQSWFGLGVRV